MLYNYVLFQGNLRNQLNMWWNSLNEGEKMYYGIFLANATGITIHLYLYQFNYFLINHI